MKYLFIILSILFTISIYADETNQEEFKYIKPISVEKSNNTQKSYFADFDKDGVSDDKDKCPDTKRGSQVDLFGCILLDDSDKDGISDVDDKCPNSKDGATVNLEGCEPDQDGDGVSDDIDECPDSTDEFTIDKVGCPQGTTLYINFKDENKEIDSSSISDIEKLAEFLRENSNYQVIIYGFTDNQNSTKISKQISKIQAHTVMNSLINLGIKLTRLTAIGMGSIDPIADNNTQEGRDKNNRIEIGFIR